MRRWIVVVAVAVVAVAAVAFLLARSNDDDETTQPPRAASARAEALAYAPRTAPAVIGVDTASPGASLVLGALVPRVSGGALSASDISPLLGNEAVVAVLDSRARREQVSMVAKDADALKALARRLRATGRYRGAQLYTAPQRAVVATKGATLVAATDEAAVRAALDVASERAGHMTPAEFDRRLAGLDRRADVRAIFDPKRVVVATGLPGALRTNWGRGLTNGAAVLTSTLTGLRLPFVLQTDPARVADGDLPFAPGAAPAPIEGRAPLLLGARGFNRLVRFLRATSPARLGGLDSLQNGLPSFLRVNVDGLLGGLTGPGTISSRDRLEHFVARTDPSDPDAWRRPLGRLATISGVLQNLGIDNVELDEEPGEAYSLRVDGELVARVGLFGSTLVATDDPRANLGAAANAPAAPTPPGARGGLSVRMAASEGHGLLTSTFGLPAGANAVLDRLGDLTGWARAEREGVRGELQLPVR